MSKTPPPRTDLALALLRCKWKDAEAQLLGPPTDRAVLEAIVRVYESNTKELRDIVDEIGWPGRSLVGEEAANAAFLIAQHSDADRVFQRRARDLVAQAAEVGEATHQQMAYLIDRCCLNSRPRRPQVYGTQYIPGRGGLLLYAVEDAQRLDARRAAIGLEPYAEYDARIRGGLALFGGESAT
ncbi:DUF6624 domain-containing protein [Streptomyces sp. NBC_01262]|uniref:DUF6624 domain-containing protein n=1 Tax=Streptomyces sp. NBC_01262 TaxID=2903803 RepID=UPI002E335BE8|nr:DUF6624 domain-containing protein [Streptomyces sp. NBC_01262]